MRQTFSAILALSFLAMLGVESQPIGNQTTASITWFPCPQNESFSFDCGNLSVPLDYTDLSSGQLTLQMVRLNATKEPFKGSILFNQGGPGGIGRNIFLNGSDEYFLDLTGGHYNLIAFDPRGTGDTLPFSCYALNDTVSPLVAQLTTPFSTNSSETAPGTIWASKQVYAEDCLALNNETGSLIGTAFVARDMMQIVDALNEDGLLRYYGYSYGTVLGATVAAMFPDRMDRLVFDGVVNAHEWGSNRPFQTAASADATFSLFLESCAAAPDQCPLAQHGTDANDLQRNIDQLLTQIKYEPIALGPVLLTDFVDYGLLKFGIWQGLYSPFGSWPALAGALDAVFTGNLTGWRYYSAELVNTHGGGGDIFPNYGLDAERGIRCSDVFTQALTNNLTSLIPALEEIEASGHYVSDTYSSVFLLTCSEWLMTAKEVYTGNFQVQTKNPILLIGSPYDPVTPLISAQNVSAGFEGSVVLQHNGAGHPSTAQPSNCTQDAIRAYFDNGTLPAAGTQCNPNMQAFTVPSA